eukprot:1992480-Rhodomonas_salina.3
MSALHRASRACSTIEAPTSRPRNAATRSSTSGRSWTRYVSARHCTARVWADTWRRLSPEHSLVKALDRPTLGQY